LLALLRRKFAGKQFSQGGDGGPIAAQIRKAVNDYVESQKDEITEKIASKNRLSSPPPRGGVIVNTMVINEFNRVQINHTEDRDAAGKLLKHGLMINIRANDTEEAVKLYADLRKQLSGLGVEEKAEQADWRAERGMCALHCHPTAFQCACGPIAPRAISSGAVSTGSKRERAAT
jgi:phosphomannomutase